MNNNNRNGKEVHSGQIPDNMPKQRRAKPVNRIKKKNTSAEKEITPAEPKKIPITVNKNPRNQVKGNQKGQVIQLGEKEGRIYPGEAAFKENIRTQPSVVRDSGNREVVSEQPSSRNAATDINESSRVSKESFKLSNNTGNWLLIAAVILFIAWAVIFLYYKIGGNSHMLLALSVICAIISLVGRRNK